MKVTQKTMNDVVSIDRMLVIEEAEDETNPVGELEAGVYAMDSTGRVWKLMLTMTGVIQEFTEHDGVKRRRGKRLPT